METNKYNKHTQKSQNTGQTKIIKPLDNKHIEQLLKNVQEVKVDDT